MSKHPAQSTTCDPANRVLTSLLSMSCALRGTIGHGWMFGAVLPGKLGIDQHGRDIHSRSNLLGCSPPAPTCWNTELCLSKRKYLSQVLSYTPVGARTRPWDLPARRSLCSIWVTFARDKTSPNYTSRVQRPHPTGLISAPNGARQAGSPPGMRSWMSRDNAGITPGCGSNLTGS